MTCFFSSVSNLLEQKNALTPLGMRYSRHHLLFNSSHKIKIVYFVVIEVHLSEVHMELGFDNPPPPTPAHDGDSSSEMDVKRFSENNATVFFFYLIVFAFTIVMKNFVLTLSTMPRIELHFSNSR